MQASQPIPDGCRQASDRQLDAENVQGFLQVGTREGTMTESPKWEAGGRWTTPSFVPTVGYHSIHITHNTLYTYICGHVYCMDIH